MVLGGGRVVRTVGTCRGVGVSLSQPGTYIRCNFHAARLDPELSARSEGPFGNSSRFFKVLRISLSYPLCNEHRLFRRFCPDKRPQAIDQTSEFRKWPQHAASTA